jgi:hypothetical protein
MNSHLFEKEPLLLLEAIGFAGLQSTIRKRWVWMQFRSMKWNHPYDIRTARKYLAEDHRPQRGCRGSAVVSSLDYAHPHNVAQI